MKIADITMAGELIALKEEWTLQILGQLRDGNTVWCLNDNDTAGILFDPVGRGKWIPHVLSKPEVRGKELWAFGRECVEWMVKYKEMEWVLAIHDKNNRAATMFALKLGIKKIGSMGEDDVFAGHINDILRTGR